MLFNSYSFIFIFLPVVYLIWLFLTKYKKTRILTIFLILASLAFYVMWDLRYLPLLLFSLIVNYFIAARVAENKPLLIIGLVFNILLLGFFKYTNFILHEFGITNFTKIILPAGISFYTFQQIAFLVDRYRKEVKEPNFFNYLLFVTFFPHLIAGPIVHHKEMIPQFDKPNNKILENFIVGITIFIIGLFKKVVLADSLGAEASGIFSIVEKGYSPTFLEAWGAALFYTFQIYFDFSGYSDMAIGIARLFGIKLPINFFSPYKSASIIEFWRRWHITLSRFLRTYIYIPLGGNRNGKSLQLCSIFITMLIGGIWHGASWTMVLWGAMHGALLVLNYLIRWLLPFKINQKISVLFVFIIIVFTWVPFRADSINSTLEIYKGMFGLNGIIIPQTIGWILETFFIIVDAKHNALKFDSDIASIIIPLSFLICWFLPNTYEWLHKFKPALATIGYRETEVKVDKKDLCWAPTLIHAVIIGFMFFFSLVMMNDASEFLYFRF